MWAVLVSDNIGNHVYQVINNNNVTDSGMSVSFQSGSAGSAGTVSQESSPQQMGHNMGHMPPGHTGHTGHNYQPRHPRQKMTSGHHGQSTQL